MGCNVGKTDQLVRYILGIVLVVAYFLHWVTGTWGWVSLILGIIFVVTAAIRFCPLYVIFGINTCNKD
ncbi:YgaP family membrane protein [Oceanithermus sp.]